MRTHDVPTAPEAAAQRLFDDPRSHIEFVATDEAEATRAVEEFGRLFESAPGVFREALDGARSGAETLSHDRLQGLAEIIQNADDAEATFVEFSIIDGSLIAKHDGRPLTLSDVLSLATPWLSNKTDNATATGRYGIGLMTLRSLSSVLDVHAPPYHLRLGDPTISAIDAPANPRVLEEATTSMRVPLQRGSVTLEMIDEWLDQWDDAALLFLRSVGRVSVVSATGKPVRTLTLQWSDQAPTNCPIGGREVEVSRRHATASNGRRWLVHTAEAPRPKGLSRVRKASNRTVPIGLALPLHPGDRGQVYAGLPLEEAAVPIRINAQFDPVTSRKGMASTDWNRAMVPLLADLWVETVDDLFAESPSAAWEAVPLPADDVDATTVVRELEESLLGRARDVLATRVRVPVEGDLVALTRTAVEHEALTGVLDDIEVRELAGLDATLPANARDAGGRWRAVLSDWRSEGGQLPPEVVVEDALGLLADTDRSTKATIALASAGIRAGLTAELSDLPWVTTASGDRIVPPGLSSLHSLVVSESPLAEQLGLAIRLHDEHLARGDGPRTALNWLEQSGAVLDGADNEAVLRRLARAGSEGHSLDEALSNPQLRSLRDAMESMPSQLRSELGREIGRAIQIAAFRYSPRGTKELLSARPADVYLPPTIDKEPDSFARAAARTPGLVWADSRYAEQLRSTVGRAGGLGPQKFLGLLGAERAPRTVRHPELTVRYVGSRPGLPLGVAGAPSERSNALRALGATYTLDDCDSPDLRAVANHIARERKVSVRRQRAVALLGALSRQWDRLEDSTVVDAANDYYDWQHKGTARSFWAWSIGSIPWLDDTGGTLTAPLGLRLRTQATVAVHGKNAPGYLRPEYERAARPEVLSALGVTGDPSTSDIVDRLRELRATDPTPANVDIDAAIAYRALAERVGSGVAIAGDLSHRELRQAFSEGAGLIYTNIGWQPPSKVFAGPAIFRDRGAFVPQSSDTDALWRVLQVRQPSLEDCIRVLGQVGRTKREPGAADSAVLLETLRLLRDQLSTTDPSRSTQLRLKKLPLWTSAGWVSDRPIFASSDSSLLAGLRNVVAVWEPGGDVDQFTSLLEPLDLTLVTADDAVVARPENAIPDADATELFVLATAHLQEDMARNAPTQAAALSAGWSHLGGFEVRVDPELAVSVEGLSTDRSIIVPVDAKADPAMSVLFLSDPGRLRRIDGGGSAIATLFGEADRRQVAQAWLAACVAAEDGRHASRVELAAQQAAEERARRDREMAERTAALGDEIRSRHAAGSPGKRSSGSKAPDRADRKADRAEASTSRPRQLVDPGRIRLVTSTGASGGSATSTSGTKSDRRGRSLPGPNRRVKPPKARTPAPTFTAIDKEKVGLELARIVLGGDEAEIIDIRAQHGVGADAVDELDRFYELKVHLGEEPDTIRMEDSQIRRAMSTPDFFLVVVSNVEGLNAKPKVRIIIDPVNQLRMTESSAVSFSGVRSAEHSLTYTLEQAENLDEVDEQGSDEQRGS